MRHALLPGPLELSLGKTRILCPELVPNFPINFSVTSQLYEVIYMYKVLAGSEYRLVLVTKLQSQPSFYS